MKPPPQTPELQAHGAAFRQRRRIQVEAPRQRAGILLGGNTHISPTVQRQVAERFAKEAGLEVVALYEQFAPSGPPPPISPLKERILEDVLSGQLQVLLCSSVEQLGEHLAQVAEMIEILNAHGARLVSLAGDGVDDVSNRLMLWRLAAADEAVDQTQGIDGKV